MPSNMNKTKVYAARIASPSMNARPWNELSERNVQRLRTFDDPIMGEFLLLGIAMFCLNSRAVSFVLAAMAILFTWPMAAAAQNQNPAPSLVQNSKGICGLTDVEALPFLKRGVQINYTGSMDKKGGNADWDWWLYQDPATAEWVIFDVDGPGCIHQFYNHRGFPGYQGAPASKTVSRWNAPDTIYRFYFDGADKPQFTIKASEFGTLPGFESPLTDMYINWVKRTWFPMFFRKSCKITSSARLLTGPGGWGTVVFHSYATPDEVPTFQGFLPRLQDVKRTLTTKRGQDPKPTDGNIQHTSDITLPPGGRQTLLDTQGCASIASCSLKMEPYNPDVLQKVRVRLYFDDLNKPCVDVPFGAFFGNVRGATSTPMVMQGLEISKEGSSYKSARGYNYFPMPFWKAARIEVLATTDLPASVHITAEVAVRPSEKTAYPKNWCGYFRSAYREPYTPEGGEDIEYASIRGTGHLVSSTFASRSTCEEDFRFYVDGCATAKLESDGAESWGGFGWGFQGPYSGPLTCQDRRDGWTQTRNLLGECYPFYSRIDVRQENICHGGEEMGVRGYQPAKVRDYHGAVFYYGIDQPTLVQTDTLDVGDPASERAHAYRSDGEATTLTSRYEGCSFEDHQFSGGSVPGEVTDSGRAVKTASEFTVAIRPDNDGVRLRRRSDQQLGRQRAQVFVDGEPVAERTWYRADRNPFLRWLEDEFEIPAHYTKGKNKIRVKLVFQPTVLPLPPQPNEPPTLPGNCLTAGHFGQALRGGAFQQPLACLLNAPKPEYTVDFWVRFAEQKPGVQPILLWSGFWDILTDNGYIAVRTDSKLGRNIHDAKTGKDNWGNVQHTATDALIADGNWHHIALSENGQRLCLFVDGKRIFEETVERKQPFATGGRLTVGFRDVNMLPFDGMLDDLRFTSVFRDTVAVPTASAVPDSDTFALWRFDSTQKSDRLDSDLNGAPSLIAGSKAPIFVSIDTDAPAKAWSEFYYWAFSYVPLK